MNLEWLKQRKLDLENAALQAANNFHVINGHKAEVEFWIGELMKVAEDVVEHKAEEVVAPEAEDVVEHKAEEVVAPEAELPVE